MMIRSILLLFLLWVSGITNAQTTKADSLIRISKTIGQDSNYVSVLNQIAEELSDKDADQSLDFAIKAQLQAIKIKDVPGLGKALNNIGWAYYRKGDYSKGFDYALRHSESMTLCNCCLNWLFPIEMWELFITHKPSIGSRWIIFIRK